MSEFKGTRGDIRRFNNRVEEWGQYHHIKICEVSTGSEFDDYTSLAQEFEDEIEGLIKEVTE